MAELTVYLPGLLRDCVGGRRAVQVAGATLADALADLDVRYPLLHVHLYDEADHLRPHVLIFYNEHNVARLPTLAIPVHPGDWVQILQAVSGG